MKFVLKKGNQTQTVTLEQLRDSQLMNRYFQAGWSMADGADVRLDNVYAADLENNLVAEPMTAEEYYQRSALGTAPALLTGMQATEARYALNQQQRAQASNEDVEGALGMALSAAEGISSMIPGGTALVEGSRELLYDDPALANEIAAQSVAANPLSHLAGAGGMFLGQYIASGGTAGITAASTLGRIGQTAKLALGGGIGGAARRAGGLVSGLSRARLGSSSFLANTAAWMGAAVAEDVTASTLLDLNQIVAGREDFVAENILANAGEAAMAGLLIEGSLRGVGAGFKALRGMTSKGVGMADEVFGTALPQVDSAALRQELDLVRQTGGSAEDVQSVVHSHLQAVRAQGEDTAYSLAMRNAREAVEAGEQLSKLAPEITKQLDTSFKTLRNSLDDIYAPKNIRRTIRESGALRNLRRSEILPAVIPELQRARMSAARGAGKGQKQIDKLLQRTIKEATGARNGEDLYVILAAAQDEAAQLSGRVFRNSNEILPDGAFVRGKAALDELPMRDDLWGDMAAIRRQQQDGVAQLKSGMKELSSTISGRLGRDIDLSALTLDSNKLNRLFKDLSSNNITQNFDNIVSGIYKLRVAAEALPDSAAVVKMLDEAAIKMVEANRAATLKAAMNDLSRASDEAGKNIATFRSMKGLVGAGSLTGAAIGGIPGALMGFAGANLVRPITQVKLKAGLQKFLSGNYGKFGEGLAKVQKALRGARPTAVTLLNTEKKRKEAFEREWEKTQKFALNQLDVADVIAQETEPFGDEGYALAPYLANGLITRQSYIAQTIPQPIVDPLQPSKIKAYPSRTEMAEFAHRLEVVYDPFSLLERIADGSVTAAGVEAAQVVYPQLFADMLTSVGELVYEEGLKGSVPYRLKVNLSQAFGLTVDQTLTPGFVMAMQQSSAQTPSQAEAIGASRPVSTRRMKLPEQTATVTERISN